VKTFTIITCGAVLSAVVGVVLLLRRPVTNTQTSRPQDASLDFVGFTNVPIKGQYAMFCLTNGTRVPIVCVPDAVEQLNEGAWMRTPLTGRARRVLRDWIGVQEELRPGEAFTFSVPPPTTNAAWRLIFLCQERAPVTDTASDLVRHVTDTNAASHQDRRFSGRRYFVTTPKVAK
jgi:hypothetical protein